MSKRANSKTYLSKESRSLFEVHAVAAFTDKLRICCLTSTTSPEKREANKRTASGNKSETSSQKLPQIKHADARADALPSGRRRDRRAASPALVFFHCRVRRKGTLVFRFEEHLRDLPYDITSYNDRILFLSTSPCCSSCLIATKAEETTDASTDRHSSRS